MILQVRRILQETMRKHRTGRRHTRRTRNFEPLEARLAFDAGDLDLSFDRDGIVEIGKHRAYRSQDQFISAELDPSNRVVVLARIEGQPALARFRADGTLDASFGTEGKVSSIALDGHAFELNDVAYQSNGNMILAGSFSTVSGPQIALLRVDENGDLDPSFGVDGIGRADPSPLNSAKSLLVASDGVIFVLAGSFGSSEAVIKFRPDGTLDRSFGEGGFAKFQGDGFEPYDLAMLSDGSLVVLTSNRTDDGLKIDLALIRFLPDGSRDMTFGGSETGSVSIQTNNTESGTFRPAKLLVTAEDKILVGMTILNDDIHRIVLAQFLTNGQVDTAFGTDGQVRTAFSGDWGTYIHDLARGPDNTILMTGVYEPSASNASHFLSARFNSDGSYDDSFANGGVYFPDIPFHIATNLRKSGLLRQADGRQLALFSAAARASETDIALIAISEAGSLDPSFSGDGLELVNLVARDRSRATARSLVSLADGRILSLVSDAWDDTSYLYRYRADGSVDLSYGDGGKIRLPIKPSFSFGALPPQLLERDGRLFVAMDANRQIAKAKLLPSGEIDSTFGDKGWIYFPYAELMDDVFTIALADPSGFYLGGMNQNFGQQRSEYVIARVLEDGQPDESFGAAGIVQAEKFQSVSGDGMELCVDKDGKLLSLVANTPVRMFAVELLRYLPNGELDREFGDQGRSLTSVTTGYNDPNTRQVLCASDASVMVVGTRQSGVGGRGTIVANKFDKDGHVVPGFGAHGTLAIARPEWPSSYPWASDLDQSDRLVIGARPHVDSYTDWAVIRVTADGKLDESFADGGIRQIDVHGRWDSISDLDIDSVGDVLFSGDTYSADDQFATIARVRGDRNGPSIWHRQELNFDTNGDSVVSTMDALVIINDLNVNGARELPPVWHEGLSNWKLDVTGDWWATPLDALAVINRLNEQSAEGEQPVVQNLPLTNASGTHAPPDLQKPNVVLRKSPLIPPSDADRYFFRSALAHMNSAVFAPSRSWPMRHQASAEEQTSDGLPPTGFEASGVTVETLAAGDRGTS